MERQDERRQDSLPATEDYRTDYQSEDIRPIEPIRPPHRLYYTMDIHSTLEAIST